MPVGTYRQPWLLTLLLSLALLAGCRGPAVPTPGATPSPEPATVPASPEATATVEPPVVADTPSPRAPATEVASTATPASTPTTAGGDGTPEASMPETPPHGVAGGDSIDDPYIPELGNTGYDVQHYTLAMTLDPATEQLSATASISATATLADLGRVSLDFIGYAVGEVRVAGEPAAFYRGSKKLYVDLPQPMAEGAPFTIEVDYSGDIEQFDSQWAPGEVQLGIVVRSSTHLVAFSEPDGARAWFPANDHPLDKATFRVEATVPEGLTAVSNGRLLETRDEDEQRTFVWEMDAPMATYLLTLAVGEYERIEGSPVGDVDIRHYVFPEDAPRATPALSATNEILAFFAEMIAPYPFESYGHVEVLLPGLAMETQTMVMMDREAITNVGVMAHEAAHHWFGDSVTPATWGDIWLNEGFATYLELLWSTRESGDLEQGLGQMETTILRRADAEDEPLDTPEPRYMFAVNTYFKGAWVLHMLRQEVGDDAFFETLRQYYQRFAEGNARTADLQAVAEEVSGRDLDAFFGQWVSGPGQPDLQVSWAARPVEGGAAIEVQVCQLQRPDVFAVPLDFNVGGTGGLHRDRAVLDERQERLSLTLPFTPTEIILDPDQHLLAESSTREVEELQACPGQ